MFSWVANSALWQNAACLTQVMLNRSHRPIRLLTSSSALQTSRWSAEEDQRLFTMRKDKKTTKEIANAFPNRTVAAIGHRIDNTVYKSEPELRRKQVSWTQEEHDTLLTMRQAGKTMKQIAAAMPNRSPVALRMKVQSRILKTHPELRKQTGYGSKSRRAPWTSELSKTFLQLREEGKTREQIRSEAFPDRSLAALGGHLKFLIDKGQATRIYKWTPFTAEEENNIRRLHGEGLTVVQIAQKIAREPGSVASKLFQWGIPHLFDTSDGTRKPLSKAELETLKAGLKRGPSQDAPRGRAQWSYQDIMQLVPGRTYNSIKYNMYKLRKEAGSDLFQKRIFTPAEDNVLMRWNDALLVGDTTVTLADLASKLGRSRKSVELRLWRLRNLAKFANRAGKKDDSESSTEPQST